MTFVQINVPNTPVLKTIVYRFGPFSWKQIRRLCEAADLRGLLWTKRKIGWFTTEVTVSSSNIVAVDNFGAFQPRPYMVWNTFL